MGTFEEVNLRFYVKRLVGNEIRRGVVFINETVPNKIVAWLANALYKEHYIAIPTRYNWRLSEHSKDISYRWKVQTKWNAIDVVAGTMQIEMQIGSMEEFIFEHYYGYTKINTKESMEYKVNHGRWTINELRSYVIDCDFGACYGKDFSVLNKIKPKSVYITDGSAVSIDWKRIRFNIDEKEQ